MNAPNTPVIRLRGAGITYRTGGLFPSGKLEALRDIDLDILGGENLGVMGANGSGKSTLLKLLARIYRPDSGHVEYHVRKISLLSLALGFDGRLSGADNALLSSMLLGATRQQAADTQGAILEFAELGRFANAQLRTYSSGMRSRLGFAVAIHMHTDVLLIDEALAVGDAHFREKSEQAIKDKLSSEQTVVLVSHSAGQVEKLCDRAVWLDQGQIKAVGDPAEVAARYQAQA